MDERTIKRSGGYLSPAAEARLLGEGDLDLHVNRLLLFREYVLFGDVVEYVLYFYDRSDQKRRVSFEIPVSETWNMTHEDIEDYVSRKARTAIMKEIEND